MGLPWIKVYADLPEHPKSLDLGEALDEPLAWAYVVRLWAWCSRFAQDGRVPRARVEHAAGWPGKKGAFLAAALKVGFLDDGETTVLVHDWSDTQKAHLDKMERDRRAAEEKRSRGSRTTIARPSRDHRAVDRDRDREGEREEEREEERPQQPPEPAAAPVLPPSFPPADQRITGLELQALWNAVARAPAKIRPWAAMAPGQEMQADALAIEFDRPTWVVALDRIRRSSFLNGHGERGWLLTPQKLLRRGRPLVAAVLNGEYDGPNDMPPDDPASASGPTDEKRCRKHPDRRAVNLWSERCGDCELADVRGEAPP